METAVQGVGFVLLIVGAVGLVVNLLKDIKDILQPPGGFAISSFGDFLGKLPEKYIPSTVVFLLGLAMVDPTTFDKIWPGS